MYYYADRTDKAGNRLLTSYGKQAQAVKYGGASARVFAGERFMTVRPDGTASMGDEGDLLVRTLMIKPKGATDTAPDGKFVVYAKIDGKWERTSFRYKTYSLANQAVKSALINLYEACAVVEITNEDKYEGAVEADSGEDESAPFDV